VESVGALWEAYAFATREIVEEVPSMLFEKNYIVSLVLRLSAFPSVYSNWEKYESCAVDEVSLGPSGTVLGPLDLEGAAVPIRDWRPEKELVLECGKMVDDYGLSLIARDGVAGIVGMATLRVKRLPEGCHVDWDGEEDPSVVCTVEIDAVYEAAGLEAVAYLESIAVARGWRGSGLAASLLAFVEEKARTWGLKLLALHVHRDNWSALRFYSRRGFEVTSDWLGWGSAFFLLLKPL